MPGVSCPSASLDCLARAEYLPRSTRYLIAALAAAAALLLRFALQPLIGFHTPFSTMYPAIAFSALFLGIGPSLLCTVVGLVAVDYFFLVPRGTPFTALNLELLAEYLLMAALLILAGEVSSRSRRRAERAESDLERFNDELEHKIDERTKELASSLENLQEEIEVRRKAEKRLSELSVRLIHLQDEERRRIARELHDSTGQTLTAMKMTLAVLEKLIPDNPKAADLFCDLHALSDQALTEIRTLSHLLHPPLLDEVGFPSAARWYVDARID